MTTPNADGFYMPAEFEPHHGTVLVFPERPGSWGTDPSAAQAAFSAIAARLSRCEQVYMLVNDRTAAAAERMLPKTVKLLHIDTDDAWARDIAPTFVRNAAGEVRGISWQLMHGAGHMTDCIPIMQTMMPPQMQSAKP